MVIVVYMAVDMGIGRLAAQIAQQSDLALLKESLERMRGQSAQVPPDFKPMLNYLMSKLEARIAELEGGQ